MSVIHLRQSRSDERGFSILEVLLVTTLVCLMMGLYVGGKVFLDRQKLASFQRSQAALVAQLVVDELRLKIESVSPNLLDGTIDLHKELLSINSFLTLEPFVLIPNLVPAAVDERKSPQFFSISSSWPKNTAASFSAVDDAAYTVSWIVPNSAAELQGLLPDDCLRTTNMRALPLRLLVGHGGRGANWAPPTQIQRQHQMQFVHCFYAPELY